MPFERVDRRDTGNEENEPPGEIALPIPVFGAALGTADAAVLFARRRLAVELSTLKSNALLPRDA